MLGEQLLVREPQRWEWDLQNIQSYDSSNSGLFDHITQVERVTSSKEQATKNFGW